MNSDRIEYVYVIYSKGGRAIGVVTSKDAAKNLVEQKVASNYTEYTLDKI